MGILQDNHKVHRKGSMCSIKCTYSFFRDRYRFIDIDILQKDKLSSLFGAQSLP